MGGPGSGRFSADPETRAATLTEMQEENLLKFRRFMAAEYPLDDQEPKRTRAQIIFDDLFETARDMGRRRPGSPPSVKGFSEILPYLVGMPRQGLTLEANIKQESPEWDLSKLSDDELHMFAAMIEVISHKACTSCGSRCGGTCRKALPPSEVQ